VNLDRQVKSQVAVATQKELEDFKSQMEKNKNNLVYENYQQRNVRLCVHVSVCLSVCVCGADMSLSVLDIQWQSPCGVVSFVE